MDGLEAPQIKAAFIRLEASGMELDDLPHAP
jgi:hypothetical protein